MLGRFSKIIHIRLSITDSPFEITMLNKNSDDSSSSEDEASKNALKEATDHQFFKDIYFSSRKSENSEISETLDKHSNTTRAENSVNVKSLRPCAEQQDKFENFGVSASYQNYVAKKLNEIIEKSIKVEDKRRNEVDESSEKDETNSGIKLFNSSTEFLTTEEDTIKSQKRPKRRKIKHDDKSNELKCKEVAVNPERILSKTDTEAWTSKRQQPEFKYKRQKNGILLEQT